MNPDSRASAYLEAQVLGSSPEQLVVLLYDHLSAHLGRAKTAIAGGEIEKKAASLEKASAILYELLGTLDHEAGGELAARLAALYAFFLNEISQVGRTLEAERLDPLISMIRSLRSAWTQAADAATSGSAGPPGSARS